MKKFFYEVAALVVLTAAMALMGICGLFALCIQYAEYVAEFFATNK